MTRSNIFVSYSHENRDALQQLERFLKPLERDGLINSWSDKVIALGEDWKAQIHAAIDAASIAILFISQDFLASDFIYQEELPRILARANNGELTVIPIFLSPADIEHFKVPLLSPSGDKSADMPIRFQGMGTPEKPLSDLTWSDCERLYKDLAADIRKRAGAVASTPVSYSAPPVDRTSTIDTNIPLDDSRRYTLTVHLRRHGDSVDAQYYLPGTDAITNGAQSWRQAAQAQSPSTWGARLFELLFGTERQQEKIFCALFRQSSPPPSPILAPVRLRICTDDPLLLRLPWRLSTWNDWPLAERNWEFTTTHVLNPSGDYATYAPCEVLIVAPQAGTDDVKPDPEHVQAVIETLQQLWPAERGTEYVRIAPTRSALKNALRGMRPQLIYVHAGAAGPADRPGLRLDDGILRLSELADLCQELANPAVIYLNTPGPPEAGPSPGRLLGDAAPLVIWRRVESWQPDADFQALAWLKRWLGQGEEPLAALHAVQKRQDALQAAALTAHSTYRTWKTHPYSIEPRRRYSYLAVDRDDQKAQVGKHLKELIRSDRRRVMALTACAAPGNRLDLLHDQLRDYLELDLADLAEINWLPLQFPHNRQELDSDLEHELRLQLDPEEKEPVVKYLLRRHAPRALGNKKAVLWLNWGVFGGASPQAALKQPELEAWLHFCSGFLCSECPDDLRIVCCVAIEAKDISRLERLTQDLQRYGWQDWCKHPAFRLSVLPPLGRVSERHLYDFLVDGHTGCDPDIQAEVAQRLIAATQGDFGRTIALIQEAEQGHWRTLLARLRREQGAAPPADDEPY